MIYEEDPFGTSLKKCEICRKTFTSFTEGIRVCPECQKKGYD